MGEKARGCHLPNLDIYPIICYYLLLKLVPAYGTILLIMNTLLALVLYAISATRAVAGDYVVGSSDVRAERSYLLTDRYPVQMVSDVFRDNILLTLAYMDARVPDKGKINWAAVEKPQTYSFTLKPGEVFAFHEDVLPQFKGKVVKTMNAHFWWDEGFKSDGYLTGDGVCHLASLMYWAARDAGLAALAPTNHDFANIPDVPKQYGVAIFYDPNSPDAGALQNLYITNTFTKPVTFVFTSTGISLDLKVID